MPRLAKSGNQNEDSVSPARGSGCLGGVVCIFTSSTPPLLSPDLQLRRSTRKTTVPVHQPLSQTAPAPAPELSVFDPPSSSGVVDDCPVRKLAELLKQQKDDRIAAKQKKVAHALLSRGIKDPHKAVRGDRYVVPCEAFDSDDYDTDDDVRTYVYCSITTAN